MNERGCCAFRGTSEMLPKTAPALPVLSEVARDTGFTSARLLWRARAPQSTHERTGSSRHGVRDLWRSKKRNEVKADETSTRNKTSKTKGTKVRVQKSRFRCLKASFRTK